MFNGPCNTYCTLSVGRVEHMGRYRQKPQSNPSTPILFGTQEQTISCPALSLCSPYYWPAIGDSFRLMQRMWTHHLTHSPTPTVHLILLGSDPDTPSIVAVTGHEPWRKGDIAKNQTGQRCELTWMELISLGTDPARKDARGRDRMSCWKERSIKCEIPYFARRCLPPPRAIRRRSLTASGWLVPGVK
jgi:hypothetical protein